MKNFKSYPKWKQDKQRERFEDAMASAGVGVVVVIAVYFLYHFLRFKGVI